MKNSKLRRILLTLACAVLLVSLSVGATLAYLTDNATVTNTFEVGKVNIDLDEALVNADGTPVDGADRVKENEYKLYPAHEYTKDPVVHVESDSEDCFVFVRVTNGILAIEGENKIAAQIAANGWQLILGDESDGVYVYGAKDAPTACTKNDELPVFETFEVAKTVNNDTLATYADAEVVVVAYAIQKDMFEGKTGNEIWTEAGWQFP